MSQPTKNPNAVDLPRTDGKCATGGCQHMKEKVQLIPLRYGLVERLDPSTEIFLPYKAASRPMGIRLLRDGWLYVIDNSTGYMHEYEVKAGVVTKCIWQGKEAAQDKRTGSAGENALVFTRGSTLHVAYAEVQWTANKCSQMLKSSKERDLFMQVVKPAGADVEKGGKHLLTDKQAEKWIAEVAEKPSTETPPEGALPEESKDYIWEDQKDLFKATQLGALKKSLLPIYEKDHFFLVFKDSIGVMRDLAQDQDIVVSWLEKWASKESNDLKYSIGNYIETLMVVSEKTAKQAGTSNDLFDKTTPEQREKIYDYMNAKNDLSGTKTSQPEKAYYPGRGFDAKTRAAQQNVALKKQTMEDSLGKDLYNDLKDDIEVLEDKSHAAVEGKGLGARGIHDLVRYEEMTKYLQSERSHIKRWTARLDHITNDRVGLFTKSEYHMSAWYFDSDNPDQLESALVTEQNCIRDLCRTEKSLELVGEHLHGAPYYIFPAFSTRLNIDFFEKKKGDFVKWLDDARNLNSGMEDAKTRTKILNELTNNHWTLTLTPNNLSLSQAIQAAYSPAIAIRLQTWLSDLQTKLNGPELKAHLDKISSYSNRAHRLVIIKALQHEGVSLKVSSAQDKTIFLDRLKRLGEILETQKHLTHERNRAKKESKRRVASSDSEGKIRQSNANAEKVEINRQLFLLLQEKQVLKNQLQDSVIITNTTPTGHIGVQLNIDPSQQTLLNDEIERLKSGPLRGYGESGTKLSAFKSSAIPMAALYYQAMNLGEALEAWRSVSGNASAKDIAIFAGSLSGIISTAMSVYQNAHISVIDKALKSIVASSSGQAGKLFEAKLGKLGLGLGVIIAPLSLISSIGTMWDNWDKWTDALRTGTSGEKAGAFLALTGDVGNTGVAAATTARAFWEIGAIGRTYATATSSPKAFAVSVAWGSRGVRFLSFSASLTPWSLGFTALQLGGETLYNYFNLDDQQRWMLNCCWGREDSKWELEKHYQGLAEANMRPIITDAPTSSSPLEKPSAHNLVINFPGINLGKLKQNPIRFQAELSAQITEPARDVAEDLRELFKIRSANPLILDLEIPDEWRGEQAQLKLRLSVQPEIASSPLKKDDQFLYYPISLRTSGLKEPVKGISSNKPGRLPLKWITISPEQLDV